MITLLLHLIRIIPGAAAAAVPMVARVAAASCPGSCGRQDSGGVERDAVVAQHLALAHLGRLHRCWQQGARRRVVELIAAQEQGLESAQAQEGAAHRLRRLVAGHAQQHHIVRPVALELDREVPPEHAGGQGKQGGKPV